MRRRTLGLALGLGLGLLVACDGGPKSGELPFSLQTSHTDVGAVAFEVTALEPQTIDTLAADCTGCQVFIHRVSDRAVRGVVVGAFGAGAFLRVTVSDRSKPTLYSGRVLQAAGTDYSAIFGSEFQITVEQP